MWSYKYTSSDSVFEDQCRVGVRLEAATATSQLVDLLSMSAKEKRCKCFFFDAGTEKALGSPFKSLLAKPDRDRCAIVVGLRFQADFPFHRSTKVTTQRISAFISALGIGTLDMLIVPWPAETQGGGQRSLSEAERGERLRDGELFLKTWKSLQRLVDAGTVRSLGLDGFLPWQLDFTVSQPILRPVANFLLISLRDQKRRLIHYTHARQVEVIASLDSTELPQPTTEITGYSAPSQDSAQFDEEDGSTTPDERTKGSTSGLGSVDPGQDEVSTATGAEMEAKVVSRIAREADLTDVQVVTSWAMHRGLVTLHTVGSLRDATSRPRSSDVGMPPNGGTGGRRGSAAVGFPKRESVFSAGSNKNTSVKEVFALLHPLAARPSFYSPNHKFGFSLSDQQRHSIETLNTVE